jgi:capsule polysaccharide export protein KpsE/RkpR
MKRTFIGLFLGLVCGVGAHVAWYYFQRPAPADDLYSQLAWMKNDLHLSDAQLARIKSLHEQSSPRLLALAGRIAQMRREFALFEKQRQTVGEVDFLEFARYVEKQRALNRECADSTHRLVAATADVMTPRQREQYLTLLSPALENSGVGVLQ